MVNPAPVIAAALTVTADVPVELKVSVCVVAVFTVTLPKLRLAALADRVPFVGVTPVPLNDTVVVLPVLELLLIVICPVAAPPTVGLNSTDSINVWPGFSVAGNTAPAMLNPAPVIAAALTVTGDVPVEVNVNACGERVLTAAIPKFRLDALTERTGLVAAAVATAPIPLNDTIVVFPLIKSLVIATWPAAPPIAIGLNCTCSVVDCDGFSVIGKLAPTRLNPVPVIAAEFTVTGNVPVDVIVTDCVVAVFNATLPKLRLEAVTVRC